MRKASPFAPVAVLLLAFAAVLASGCVGTRAAYKEAQTLDEYAYVVTEHYAALVHQAADLKERPTTSRAAVEAMQRADKAAGLIVVGDPTASPAVPGLAELAATYKQVRDAETQEELQRAVDAAVLKIADLVRAIKAAGGGV